MIRYTQTSEEAIELELDFVMKFRKSPVPWIVASILAVLGVICAAFIWKEPVLIGFAVICFGGAVAIAILQPVYPILFKNAARRRYAAAHVPPVYEMQIEKVNGRILAVNLTSGREDSFLLSSVRAVKRKRGFIYVEISWTQSLLFPDRDDIYDLLCPSAGETEMK